MKKIKNNKLQFSMMIPGVKETFSVKKKNNNSEDFQTRFHHVSL